MKNQIKHLLVAPVLLSSLNHQLSTCFAQNTVATYQGRVSSNSTNFTGAGLFKFALVTSTNNNHTATATASLSGSFVTSYTVTFGGSGYISTPAVTISGGGGSNATATANLAGGVVTSLAPGSAGSGYSSAPTVTIAPPPANISYTTFWSNDGTSVNGSEPAAAVNASVNNGLFTIGLGDASLANMMAINANLFVQPDLQLRIWFNDGVSGFAVLSPPQYLTSAPYAAYAVSAASSSNLLGVVSAASLSGTYSSAVTLNNVGNSFTGNGSGLTNVNAATLGGLDTASFWKTNGNTGANPTNGAFLGTTDNLPLEIKVNGHRALRLEPDSSGLYPNVIAGGEANSIAAGLTGTTIGGGSGNNILLTGDPLFASASVIGGGAANLIGATAGSGAIAFGGCNFIGGGIANNIRAGGDFDTISGGSGNTISTNSDYDTIAGGTANLVAAGSFNSVISGGVNNKIGTNSFDVVIAGGNSNSVPNNSSFATIPGGDSNTATNYAFAAGRRAKANHQGTFVWADSQNADFATTGTNQFLVRASGGVGINTAGPVADLHVNGSEVIQGPALVPGSTSSSNLLNLMVGGGSSFVATNGTLNGISFYESAGTMAMSLGYDGSGGSSQNSLRIYHSSGAPLFTFEADGRVGIGTNAPQQALHVVGNILATGTVTGSSDRNAKENFAPVNPLEVLQRVAALPISRWNYKAETDVTHLGPMAQDFYAAFTVGMDDKHISMVDADGVALAAIQGLNQKVDERDLSFQTQLRQKDAEIRQLQQSISALEKLVGKLTAKKGDAQ